MRKKQLPDFIGGLWDSGRNTAEVAVVAIDNNPENFKYLLDICFSEPYPISMRASRVIQLFCEKKPEFILPYLDQVIEKVSVSKVEGVKRNFLKLITESVDFNLVKNNPKLLQIVFDCIISPNEAISVRYYSIFICEKFCDHEPDLIPEFKTILEFILNESSAGLRSTAIKVLKKYNR
jgi:hypothetical protein